MIALWQELKWELEMERQTRSRKCEETIQAWNTHKPYNQATHDAQGRFLLPWMQVCSANLAAHAVPSPHCSKLNMNRQCQVSNYCFGRLEICG